jgi:hypothetical protein
MQNILQKLTENVQIIYRKSIDADAIISKLQGSGKGKFKTIFAADSGFTAQSNYFKPYVEELAQDVASLSELSEAQLKQSLPAVVKKIEHLYTTMTNFQNTVRS